MKIIPSQRHLFDIPDDIAYFNCAGNSPLLNESVKRLISGSISKSHPWERTAHNYFEDAETIRQLAGEIFGSDSEGYAVIPAASYGISTAARVIEPLMQAGDSILHIEGEFPSNVLPWQRLVNERNVEIITVPTPKDGNWTQAILNKIDKNVKVLALSTCHWTNGAFIDLGAIRQAWPDKIFVIDATQSLGAMPFNFEKVRPDFLVTAGYKWLLCPYGFSLLYVDEKWRNSRPLEESWLSRENAEDFASLVNYSEKYMPGSRRFDVGEKCTPSILPGVIAALEQIKTWGVRRIAESLTEINNQIATSLIKLGFQLPGEAQRCPHMFGAKIPENFNGNLVTALSEKKIFVSQRGDSVRFAPHLHINDFDLKRLLETIDNLIVK
jgi:selenocysteine lyase/cysteine desulfurase